MPVKHFSRNEKIYPVNFARQKFYSVSLHKFVEVEQNTIIGLNHFHSEKENNIVFIDNTCIKNFHWMNVKESGRY